MAVPYTFGSATTSIPLSQLDSNFATTITLGNTAIQLGNTVTTLNNMTFANATVSSGNVTVLNATVTNDATISGLTVGKGGGAVGSNSAFGPSALQANTTGAATVAVGYQALASNTTGANSTAVGYQTLVNNTTATGSTALGYQALYTSNRTADTSAYNTGVGWQAGYALTTGQFNTFLGVQAGSAITTGSKNSIIGNYGGNYGGLDIRTSSNYIVLSDGDGNPRTYIDTNGTVVSNTKNSSGQQIAISKLNLTVGSNTLVASINSVNNITSAAVIFEATVNNAAGNDGYSVARSVREVLISSYGGVTTLLKSTELSNNTGSVNTSVINCTVTTSAVASGTTLQLYVNSTQTGVAATSTNTVTYKITIVETTTATTFTLN
jgi:hypothetical protein